MDNYKNICRYWNCKKEFTTTKKNKMYCSRKCCMTAQVSTKRILLKEAAIVYKGGCCEICGYNKYKGALEFHHTDPTQKDFNISKSGHTVSWEKMKSELDKCKLVCSNCHRELHGDINSIPKEYLNEARTRKTAYKFKIDNKHGCDECGAEIKDRRAQKCLACFKKTKKETIGRYTRKVTKKYPELEELIKLIKKNGYEEVGRIFQVSGNAIRKRIKNNNIDPKTIKKELKKYHCIDCDKELLRDNKRCKPCGEKWSKVNYVVTLKNYYDSK